MRRPRGTSAIRTVPDTITSSRRVVCVIATLAVSTKSRYSDAVVELAASRVAMTSKREPIEMPKSPASAAVSKFFLSTVSWSAMKS